MPAETNQVNLFVERRKLYTSAYRQVPGQSHQFTFVFPQRCDASQTPLPPSWKLERAVSTCFALPANFNRLLIGCLGSCIIYNLRRCQAQRTL